MPAGVYDLRVEQGATFQRTITWSADGVPVPLGGMSARLQIRKTAAAPDPPLLALSSPDGGITLDDPGVIVVTITAEQTAALGATSAVYDLEVVQPTDPETVHRLLQGKVVVSAEVTR